MPGVLEPLPGPSRPFDRPDDDESLDLYRVIVGVWDARWVVIAGVVAAVSVAAVGSLLLPKAYAATATVLVTPPTFSTDLKPAALSVEAYARLAESDLVRDRVRESLAKENFFGDNAAQLELRTILYSSRQPQQPYLPLVGLLAEWHTPEGAQRIANTWANVLVREQERITTMTGAESVAFITTEYPAAATLVSAAEREHADLLAQQDSELARARVQLGVDPDTRGETGLVIEQGEGGVALRLEGQERGPKYARMKVLDETVLRLEGDLARNRVDLEAARNFVTQLEAELKRTPQYLGGGDASGGGAQTLNPTYLNLSQQVATERARFNALAPTGDALGRELAAARQRAAELREDVIRSENQLADLQRNHAVARSSADRRVAEARAKLKPLEEMIGAAQLAQAQKESDVKLGALAPLPLEPIRPNLTRNVMIAAMIGLLLGLLGAWIVHRSASAAA